MDEDLDSTSQLENVDNAKEADVALEQTGAVAFRDAREISSPLSKQARTSTDGIDIKRYKWLFVGIAAAAILLVVWITTGFRGVNAGFVDTQKEAVQSRAVDKQKAEQEAAAAAKNADKEREKADKELKEGLIKIYTELPNLDAQVDLAYKHFDLYFLQMRAVRTPYSKEVAPIAERLDQALSDLDHLRVVNTSEYKEQATLVRSALSSLIKRCDALEKAWDLDMSYAYPSYYLEEIRAPFADFIHDGKDTENLAYEEAFSKIDLGIETPAVTEDTAQVLTTGESLS